MPYVRVTAALCFAWVLICSALAQQVPTTIATTPTPLIALGPVEATHAGGPLELRISAGGITPHKMVMKNPDRIVLDFRGAKFSPENQRKAVNQGGVLQVRASQFQLDPPVARVVIDLSKPQPSRLETQGDTIVLQIGSASQQQAAAPVAPKASAATSIATAASTEKPEIQNITVNSGPSEIGFNVKMSHRIMPKVWTEHEPDRIVMDFPGVLPGNASRRITVGQGSVETVRLSLFQEDPPITRIVFDVGAGTGKPQLQSKGDDLLVTFANTHAKAFAPVPVSHPAEAVSVSRQLPPEVHSGRETLQHAVLQDNSRPVVAQHAVGVKAASQPLIPSEMAPNPPNVRYANGLLSIDAQNSVLTDILFEVGAKTGAEIQMPPWSDAGHERVVVKLGPGNPRDVLAALLHGSSFNYVIVESPQGLQQLILTPKVDWPSGPNQQPAAEAAPAQDAPMQGPGGEASEPQAPPES
ncbi:MAG TPA: AMIN domain-containing protein [Terriglobales bacterium]|nr:AMIN domain-containing protein [Terriglobales bacterium]